MNNLMAIAFYFNLDTHAKQPSLKTTCFSLEINTYLVSVRHAINSLNRKLHAAGYAMCLSDVKFALGNMVSRLN